jgi:hypothetical protein
VYYFRQVELAHLAPLIPFEVDGMSLSGIARSQAIPRAILRYSAIALALAALLVLPGCWVTSINPLYEDGFLSSKDPDVVFDQSLIGSWIEVGDKCPAPLTITAKDGVYDLQSTGKGEGCSDSLSPSHYQARLVKLDAYYFLDVSPMADDVCDMCIARHNILLTKFDKTTLSTTPIDSDWLKKSLATKTVTLATLADDTDTITASSKDLKAFCRKFVGNNEVFKPESMSSFKRN